MDSAYIYEPFDGSHYSKFNILYENVFRKSISVREFKKRFDTKARGLEFVGFLAIQQDTGIAVAFYGVFPLKILIGHSILQAAVSGDTMTHNQHRKKGLFRTLATMTYEKCKELGIVLIYGFPNNQSYHGLVHSLGWNHVNDLTEWQMSFRFKYSPIHKIMNHMPFLRSIFNAYARRILKKYIVRDINSFNNINKKTYAVVCRDYNYIAYKQDDEKFFIKIEKVVVWIKLSAMLWIGDFSDLEQVSKPVVSRLKILARLLGYNSIRFAINREVQLPAGMHDFKSTLVIPTCLLYLEEEIMFPEFLFTPADFDTW
jgi:Acetyltransferase (GNAT) domain